MTEKRQYDADLSRGQILDSARALFIARGFDGTSLSAIARHSGVTQSMIHYYFDSKQGLWEAVKKQAFDDYLAAQEAMLDDATSDVARFVAASVHARIGFFRDHPDAARFLSWLQIMGDPLGMETGQATGRKMVAQIRRLQQAGALRTDIAAEDILAMSLALTTYWFQSRPVIEALLGDGGVDSPASADTRYTDAVIRLLTDGLIDKEHSR